MSLPHLAIVEDRCLNGWGATKRSPACNYTGGHFCDREANHLTRWCLCVCGAKKKAPELRTTVENSGGVSTYV